MQATLHFILGEPEMAKSRFSAGEIQTDSLTQWKLIDSGRETFLWNFI